jgi:protein ImuB
MKSRARSTLQRSLLQPESTPTPFVSPAGSGQGGPPRFPRVQPASAVASAAGRREWWAALQLPGEVSARQLGNVARRAQGFTPRVSLSPPDAVLLELRGSVQLFGGVDALITELTAAFPSPCTLAFAPTSLAALVFARCGVPARLSDAGRLVSELGPLPLSGLRWPEETLRRLAAIGVRTLGATLRLPRAGFARRFGPSALDMLDRLLGRGADPQRLYAAPERFRRRCDPDVELTDQAAVLALLAPVFDELEAFLVQRQRGITSLALELVHRHHAPTRQVLRLAAPAHRAQQLMSLLDLQFGRAALPAPVRRCELRSGPLMEITSDSESLWHPGEHGGGAAATQMPSFLELLRARLGAEAVSGLAMESGHRPERLSPGVEPCITRGTRKGTDHTLPLARRPLWLMSAPVPLQEMDGWPCREGQRMRLLAGPERVESGWWDGFDVERDYYQAQDAEGARSWIFRERTGRGWFLHGFFS